MTWPKSLPSSRVCGWSAVQSPGSHQRHFQMTIPQVEASNATNGFLLYVDMGDAISLILTKGPLSPDLV